MTRSRFLQLTGLTSLGLASRGLSSPEDYKGIPVGIRPYLQTPRPDSIWVSWFSDNAPLGRVEWGDSPESLTQGADAALDILEPGCHYHSVQITGLRPDTFYHYRVRNGDNLSEVFRFRTAPPMGSGARLRVLVVGDNQILSENRYERLIACAKAKIETLYGLPMEEAVNFILMPGDMVDAGTPRFYRHLHFKQCGLVSPTVPIMTTVGNHEALGDTNLGLYSKIFNYSDLNFSGVTSPGGDKYYSYQFGSVAFLHTCSELPGQEQQMWVRRFVDALKSDESTQLCISVTHRPYQSEFVTGDISGWFRNSVMPILAETEKHVLNVGAHHHLYARGQTRHWPVYHIISGGTAWDHYWGGGKDKERDDVQKTITNWAWQLIELDPAARTMEVSCYAEANVRLPEVKRWSYDSRLIDSFHRRLGLPPPGRAVLVHPGSPPVTLPHTLATGGFQGMASGENLNSTWFQVSINTRFTVPAIDHIRDVENLYGDTGAPLYEPLDLHAGLDITRYEIPADALSDGAWFARARHRDTNAQWSDWSDTVRFEITGSGRPRPVLSVAKNVFGPGEAISLIFANAPGSNTDCVGIYRKNEIPGRAQPAAWAYLNGTRSAPPWPLSNGTIAFTENFTGADEWFAAFFAGGGDFTEVAPRVPFHIGNAPVLTVSPAAFDPGATVRVAYSLAPGSPGGMIGIFRSGTNPGPANPGLARMSAPGSAGALDFPALPKGYFYAVYLSEGGELELSARAPFAVGSLISTVEMPVIEVRQGSPFSLRFRDAPGKPLDWVGVFKAGQIPGVSTRAAGFCVGGKNEGSVDFQLADLPAGEYFAALFIDDSDTEVSPRFSFKVTPPEPPQFTETSLNGSEFRMRWNSTPGRACTIQKNNGLSGDWVDVRTVTPTATTHVETLTVDPIAEPRAFFRLVQP